MSYKPFQLYRSNSISDNEDNHNNRLDSYGSFYCIKQQIIFPDDSISFEKCNTILNLKFIENCNYIKVYNSGIYTIYFNSHLESPANIGLYINDNLEKSTLTIGNNLIIINHIVKLNYGDKIYFKNIGQEPLVTLLPKLNLDIEIQNIEFTIFKISPLFKTYSLTDSELSI